MRSGCSNAWRWTTDGWSATRRCCRKSCTATSPIGRRDAIQPAFEALLSVVDDVLPVTIETLQRARDLVLGAAALSARDAVHVAVMQQYGVEEILSFDRGFDGVPRRQAPRRVRARAARDATS